MTALLPAQTRKKPIIIDVQKDAEMSGNAHARQGLARGLKQKLEQAGHECVIREQSSVDMGPPETYADIEISQRPWTNRSYWIKGRAMDAFKTPYSRSGLTMHHLTQAVMAEKSEAFDARFTKNADNIVMVNFASHSHHIAETIDMPSFIKAVVKRMGPETFTLFLCGSRHSSAECLHSFGQRAKEVAKQMGVEMPVFYFSPKAGMTPDDNPYLGLMTRAKAVIILGDSQSTVAEAVFAGKRPFTHSYVLWEENKNQKTMDDFNKGMSLTCKPRNIADAVINWHYHGYRLHRMNPLARNNH